MCKLAACWWEPVPGLVPSPSGSSQGWDAPWGTAEQNPAMSTCPMDPTSSIQVTFSHAFVLQGKPYASVLHELHSNLLVFGSSPLLPATPKCFCDYETAYRRNTSSVVKVIWALWKCGGLSRSARMCSEAADRWCSWRLGLKSCAPCSEWRLPLTLQRLMFSPSSSPGPVRNVIVSGSLAVAGRVLSSPQALPGWWQRSCKWLQEAPSPERAEVKTHFGIMEVVTARFWLVVPALLAMAKTGFLMYFLVLVVIFCGQICLLSCFVPVHEWMYLELASVLQILLCPDTQH